MIRDIFARILKCVFIKTNNKVIPQHTHLTTTNLNLRHVIFSLSLSLSLSLPFLVLFDNWIVDMHVLRS